MVHALMEGVKRGEPSGVALVGGFEMKPMGLLRVGHGNKLPGCA
jgi:hypothetical protein